MSTEHAFMYLYIYVCTVVGKEAAKPRRVIFKIVKAC